MQGVPHHLLGIYEACETKTIVDFLNACTAAIAGVHSRKKPAIVVGGTNLYIEKLLFLNSLATEGDTEPRDEDTADTPVTVCFTEGEAGIIRAIDQCRYGSKVRYT